MFSIFLKPIYVIVVFCFEFNIFLFICHSVKKNSERKVNYHIKLDGKKLLYTIPVFS